MDENKALKAAIEKLTVENLQMIANIDRLKSKAIKEFWEKLKKEKVTHKNLGEIVYVEDGDVLVKELTEQKE